jgi:four helix bundle protein
MKITRFENLDCWKEARSLANQVYKAINQNGSWGKDFRLGSQLQSASGSVMANIAEGFTRRSNKEFTQFLFIAMSSAAEVQSHLYIASDQGFISKDQFDSIYNQADKTNRMISGLIKYLRSKETKSTKQTKSPRASENRWES